MGLPVRRVLIAIAPASMAISPAAASTHETGLPAGATPDSVEVFTYANRSAASHFAAREARIIEQSHRFNADHFVEFVYLSAKSKAQ